MVPTDKPLTAAVVEALIELQCKCYEHGLKLKDIRLARETKPVSTDFSIMTLYADVKVKLEL